MRYGLAALIMAVLGCGSPSELEGIGASAEVQTVATCRPETCSGCCDEAGTCRQPSAWYCGIDAAACVQCLGTSVCSAEGRCVTTAPVEASPPPDEGSYETTRINGEMCPNRPACGM